MGTDIHYSAKKSSCWLFSQCKGVVCPWSKRDFHIYLMICMFLISKVFNVTYVSISK